LEIACRYANLKRGEEVIVPAITFIATIAYPLAVGARVVFADVDPRTLNMDPRDVQRKLSRRTRLIVPVHLGGWPVDMDPIMELAAGKGPAPSGTSGLSASTRRRTSTPSARAGSWPPACRSGSA
jgi:dTDP-4-amino-4,6-dideoxygalactose transaminase